MEKVDITVHSMVLDEPFLYYSIKSVYDYCNTILLYDTGSKLKFSYEDIDKLIKEDVDNKIIYKQDKIEFDQYKWVVGDKNFYRNTKHLKSIGHVRANQLKDTKTKYFMILDGDEVYYRDTMHDISKYKMPENKVWAQIPLTWFWDLENYFSYSIKVTGRLFKTNEISISPPPNDCARNKRGAVLDAPDILHTKPFAHFESFLKPHRRRHLIPKNTILPFTNGLPEVMIDNDYYIKRFLNNKDKYYGN